MTSALGELRRTLPGSVPGQGTRWGDRSGPGRGALLGLPSHSAESCCSLAALSTLFVCASEITL